MLEYIKNHRKDLYEEAKKKLFEIEKEAFNDKIKDIFEKSISILVVHQFIVTPSIEIKIEVVLENNEEYNYFLYFSFENEFIDEFLILKNNGNVSS